MQAPTSARVRFNKVESLASHRDSLKAKKSVGLAAGLPVAYRHDKNKKNQGATGMGLKGCRRPCLPLPISRPHAKISSFST
jgi:hypothetical protein